MDFTTKKENQFGIKQKDKTLDNIKKLEEENVAVKIIQGEKPSAIKEE